MLPAALTVFITLQTVEIADGRVYHAYWIAFWLLGIQGLISLARWWTASGTLKALVREIRSRMPEKPGINEPIPTIPRPGDPKEPS